MVPAQADINVTALFGKDGSLEGSSAAINTMLYIRPTIAKSRSDQLQPTRMMCEETVMEMEMDYLNALQSAES